MQVKARPVVLTGFDLIVDCPQCRQKQIVSDDSSGTLGNDEHVSLHAMPGRYLLNYRFRCWNCSNPFEGLLTIRSRAAEGS